MGPLKGFTDRALISGVSLDGWLSIVRRGSRESNSTEEMRKFIDREISSVEAKRLCFKA